MKEKYIAQEIKLRKNAGMEDFTPFGIMEHGRIIVKLEGYINGPQAKLTGMLMGKSVKDYPEEYAQLKKLEEKNGFVYDLSPSCFEGEE